MKKQRSSRAVHPVSDYLSSVLPAAIVCLSSGLSPGDKEVLAYLISSHHRAITPNDKEIDDNNNNNNKKKEHSPLLSCDCFGCYTSYWARWDTSPNRHLIHQIIDAFEHQQQQQDNSNNNINKSKRNKNKKKRRQRVTPELTRTDSVPPPDISQEMVVFNDDVAARDGFQENGVTNFVTFIRQIFWGTN